MPSDLLVPVSKLSRQHHGDLVAYSHPASYRIERTRDGNARLVAGVPSGDCLSFQRLAESLEAPCMLLYVLHTPRGEGAPGRYQSPSLDFDAVHSFLDRHAAFLAGDARFDLWIHSPSDNATIIWDRHNLLYAYGATDRFIATLQGLGFDEGEADASFPHAHHYRQEFDADAGAVLQAFAWRYSPLRPEDEQ